MKTFILDAINCDWSFDRNQPIDPPPFVTVASHAALMLHIMFSHTL